MALHKEKTFFHKDVTLDGNVFEDCTFTGCTLRFNGSPQVGMVRVKAEDCRLIFGGPALATIQFLGLLYQAGLGEFADEVIGGVPAGESAGVTREQAWAILLAVRSPSGPSDPRGSKPPPLAL